MHLKLAAAIVIGVILMAPGRANAQDFNAVDMLLSMGAQIDPADPQINPAPPVRQSIDVWFKHPTWVGKSILLGHYVIEHDNDRMARGEPCTHVYAFDDRENPVATFHCIHLERDRASQPTVGLATMPDGFKRLTEFQFAGESAAHGYPVR
jgi:hypothetical protein